MFPIKGTQEILNGFNDNIVRTSMIFTTDGRLLAHACATEDNVTEEVLSTILANTYQEYSIAATGNYDKPHIEYICIILENQCKFIVSSIDERFLIGCIAQPDSTFTILRTKIDKLRQSIITLLTSSSSKLSNSG